MDFDPQPPRRDGGRGMDGSAADGGAPECTGPNDCQDGDPCNGVERCEAGHCSAGPTAECETTQPCMRARCVPRQGCVIEPVVCEGEHGECGELACNRVTSECELVPHPEHCGPPSSPCLSVTCDSMGACVETSTCPDGATCGSTGCILETCNDATCIPIGMCSSGATCDAGGVCVQTPAPGRTCAPDMCHVGSCDESGACSSIAPRDCGAPTECTDVHCNPTSGCIRQNVPDGSECDTDDDLCTHEACMSGMCRRVPDCVDPVGGDCLSVACDPTTGRCMPTLLTSGETCDDGAACTGPDACQADGSCRGADTCAITGDNPCLARRCDLTVAVPICVPVDNTGTACGVGMVCDGPTCCAIGTSDCDARPGNGCECLGVCDRSIGGAGMPGMCLTCSALCGIRRCCVCPGSISCLGPGELCVCAGVGG